MTNNNFNDYINDLIKTADLLKEVAPNMTLNTKNVNVEPEKEIESKIVEALNAESEHSDTVVASLDSFKLTDNGNDYLVSHPAFQDAIMGKVAKLEYSKSPNKAELLKTVLSDSIARTASFNTTLSFTGEFKEPVVEKAAAGCDQCAASMINGVFCHETGCPNQKRQNRFEEEPELLDEDVEASAEKSWLGADLMSGDDPEPYADSEQIEENENYVLWSTPYADHTSYWVSDKTGDELNSFSTIEEARNAMATGQGLEMLDEASVAIKEDESGKSHMTDHLAQSIQAEEQVINAAQEKIKTEAVNALVAMLQSMGHGSSKIAEVSESSTGYDVMATIDSDGALRAVSIPVTVKEGKVVLPKKSLVSELISKGLNIQAALTESFSQEVLEKIAAIEELETYKEAEANQIIAERPVVKEASGSNNEQFMGDTDTMEVQKHLLPDHDKLKKGDKISDGADQWEIVDTDSNQNDKNEGSASIWKLKKCAPPASDKKEPVTEIKA